MLASWRTDAIPATVGMMVSRTSPPTKTLRADSQARMVVPPRNRGALGAKTNHPHAQNPPTTHAAVIIVALDLPVAVAPRNNATATPHHTASAAAATWDWRSRMRT